MFEGKNFLTAKELQGILRIGRDKAYALMASKEFPSIRIGRSYIVSPEALWRWAKEHETQEIELT